MVISHIPLLLSKDFIKGLGMTLNCETDTVKVHDESFNVENTNLLNLRMLYGIMT